MSDETKIFLAAILIVFFGVLLVGSVIIVEKVFEAKIEIYKAAAMLNLDQQRYELEMKRHGLTQGK